MGVASAQSVQFNISSSQGFSVSPPLPWKPEYLSSSKAKAAGDLSGQLLHKLLAVVPHCPHC